MSRFIKKPDGEWKSEERFRLWASVNKIDIMRSQPLICMHCGSINMGDYRGSCVSCGAQNFKKADFELLAYNRDGKTIPLIVFVDGNIHEKQKIEDKDIATDKQLINLGVIPIRIKSEDIDKALALYKKD